MRNCIALFALVLLCSLFPSTSNAQMSANSFRGRKSPPAIGRTSNPIEINEVPLNPTSSNTNGEVDCPFFVETSFHKMNATEQANWKKCIHDLDSDVPDPNDVNTTVDKALSQLKDNYRISTQDQLETELITTHYLSRRLRQWAKKCSCNEAIKDDQAKLDRIERSLNTFLNYTGLSDPFAGSLIAGPVFGDTGKLASGTTSTTSSSVAIRAATTSVTGTAATSSNSNTKALAHVEWGSKHFGKEWSDFDFSFGGSFGLQPALSLLTNPPPATATPTPTPTPASNATTSQFQSAFVWTLSGRANYHVGSTAEASAFVRAGQLRLLAGNGATIIDQGANSTLQIPLNSNADRMSWFYESGIEFNYYNKSLEIVHAEKGQLQPAFNVGIAYKHDSRFKQSAGVVGFDSPDQRIVFRFMINGLKIIDRRPDTTASKPYAISFGVEHERGFFGTTNPVPSGTQLIIRGDINLLKLINP